MHLVMQTFGNPHFYFVKPRVNSFSFFFLRASAVSCGFDMHPFVCLHFDRVHLPAQGKTLAPLFFTFT